MAEKLYEGKAKILYTTSDPAILLAEFKDDATAFNAQKKGSIAHKGRVNATVSAKLFTLLERSGVPTHFIEQAGENLLRLRRLQMIPLEVVVRNIVAGSLAKRTGLETGTVLGEALIEFYYKSDDLGDPLLNDDHILKVLTLVDAIQLAQLRHSALKVNDILGAFYLRCGIRLVDFKLEYGYDNAGQLQLGDELSPDNCRLWTLDEDRVLDKDRFRFDLGDVDAAYQEVLERVGATSF
ncbi:phosphoribosylaminoimidazole-succinocarboxamide synthase [Gloeobacter kilaueensis JS1]|uniref:Phosphoribosylaminoimidazole-succinocarboxamide synthase n=1 Tax=Gloeobacter kilaueensis (strain ATCC BAA-2537 / CCAP 1431/1 / ULC 316 / JS1) TaxID=1183438 RepID=U5QHQ8_GLOK1|nr:phosphoribosylaminoimidazolesuccinocarboxamide synthase [Gloeobacter kilaueensis]AGY58456.1 phosphoribosylaminoimidazole-succinocarboxamide synthase [Gloeobacter kilaueensis JS1]